MTVTAAQRQSAQGFHGFYHAAGRSSHSKQSAAPQTSPGMFLAGPEQTAGEDRKKFPWDQQHREQAPACQLALV